MFTVATVGRCHRGLLLDEVLVQIFQRSSHTTLAKAAIVCRAWNEPALRILWEWVDLRDFLNIFGRVKWENDSLRFDGGCAERSLDRLTLYGSWIKSLFLIQWLHNTLMDELRTAIAQLPQPLLPLLHDLEISFLDPVPEETDVSHALVFAGPTLRKLWFMPHYKKITSAFCMQLLTLSPFLEELTLFIDNVIESSTIAVVIKMLAHLPALRLVDIEAVASNHLIHAILPVLAGHKCLEELRIKDINVASYSVPTHHGGFASLRHVLSVSCPGISSFLKSLPSISELTVVDAHMSSRAVTEFIQVISTFKRLKSLVFEGNVGGSESPPVDALLPLRLCSMLETLSIIMFPPIPMHDNDLEALLSHLPRLISFTTGSPWQGDSTDRPNLTLRALAIITASCPMIRFISIKLDASKNADHAMVYHPTLLNQIDVQRSYIEDTEAVARFLARLPASAALKLEYHNMMNGHEGQWKEVGVGLSLFQDARDRGASLARVADA
ncbi:hypothetical protein FRB94_009808 [Tulasnella sp. JGI-2019a]|nr:hypothetical protein FRB94_009808 [Tulasnella sp. JGI-2019a]